MALPANVSTATWRSSSCSPRGCLDCCATGYLADIMCGTCPPGGMHAYRFPRLRRCQSCTSRFLPAGRRALHDGRAPVDALLLDRIAAGRRVKGAAVVPDHDVAQLPLVAVLRRGRRHVIGELADQRFAFGGTEALDTEDVIGVGIQRLA